VNSDSEAETRSLSNHERETATRGLSVHSQETDAGPVQPESADHLPDQIGDYEILRELARGGMGVVYLARSNELHRQVALKVLRGGDDHSRDGLERFQTEARVIARLRHPHIVGIHEVGTCQGRSYLVMDYIEGGSLRDRLEEGTLDPPEAAKITKVMAEALAYAHERSILHRDVKPGNILLSSEGPVLTDFGLAKDVSCLEASPTLSGQPIGTPAYMAPEQARGDQEQIDRRTDVYALGATLYEMLSGAPPFTGGSVYDVLDRLTQEPPPRLRKVRPDAERDLETIILTCLAKDPARRYPTAGALAEDLRRYLEHEPIEARRPSPLERCKLWLRRHRRVAQTAGVSLIALVVVAGTEAQVLFARLRRDHDTMEAAQFKSQRERDSARSELAKARASLAALQSSSALAARARRLARREDWAGATAAYRQAFASSPSSVGVLGFEAAEAAGWAAQGSPGQREGFLAEAASWLQSAGDKLSEPEREKRRGETLRSPGLSPWREDPAFAQQKGPKGS